MKITNPETKQEHEMDKVAYQELREVVQHAKKHGGDEVVFRAMLIDRAQAERILVCDC